MAVVMRFYIVRDSGISIGVSHPKQAYLWADLIGCWAPDDGRAHAHERDANDSCWPFSAVSHRVAIMKLVSKCDRVCSTSTISAAAFSHLPPTWTKNIRSHV